MIGTFERLKELLLENTSFTQKEREIVNFLTFGNRWDISVLFYGISEETLSFVKKEFGKDFSFLLREEILSRINFGELEEKLLSEIRQKYRGENIDYINFVIKEKFKELLFLSRIGSIKLFSQYSYASFVGHAVRLLTKELIDRLQIRSLQDFKFVTIYIEPNILLIRNLIEERFDFVIYNEKFCLNLIEFFLPKKYPYIDLHVHAETSYQFSALMETTVRNFSSLFSEILKRERVKKKKILPRLNAIVEYFFHTCCSFRTFSEKKIILRATNFSLKKSYNSFVLQRFNYHEFLHSLLRKLKSFENGSFSKNVSPLIEVLILQLLNEIYASISFTGEYKGLKYMAKNFKHPIKKAYQEKEKSFLKGRMIPLFLLPFQVILQVVRRVKEIHLT